MKRTTVSEANPKNIFAKNDLYNNMSHHYRRLYNAKPCVDNSLPKPYEIQKQKKKFVSSRVYCCRPYDQRQQILQKKEANDREFQAIDHRIQNCRPKDGLEDIRLIPFHPRILKTETKSKVRNLREYHPPRKKYDKHVTRCNNNRSTEKDLNKLDKEGASQEEYGGYEDDRDWLQTSNSPQDSRSPKPCSSDSAYTEEGEEGIWSGADSRGCSPQNPGWQAQLWCDDQLYIKFLKAITDEVLRKGIYTNKALKIVFQDHINRNKHTLNVMRMQKEVKKLENELGIPSNDDLNSLDFGLGSGPNLGSYVELNEYIEMMESIDNLSLHHKKDEMEDRLSSKKLTIPTLWNARDSSCDIIELPLMPDIDKDNDSILGYDTGNIDESNKSERSSLGDR